MKKILIALLALSMIAVTGNTHAMFKNIFNSFCKPALSLEQKQALVKKQFPMPPLPPHRIHPNDMLHYNNLCKNLATKKDHVKQWRKSVIVTSICAPAAFLSLPSLYCWMIAHACAAIPYQQSKKAVKNLEQEIKDVISTQKRELRLRDDVQ
jgi:hypothetical protein